MPTIAGLLSELPQSKRAEAEFLVADCLQQSHAWLLAHPDYQLTARQQGRAYDLLERLREGHPFAYLLGKAGFYGLELEVTRDVLIPRADSEILIEAALALDLPEHARVADLGCGSGAIACALASHKSHWRVDAADISLAALRLTATNAARLGLSSQVTACYGDWWQALSGKRYDLVITNPPYVLPGDPALDVAVAAYEPPLALYAGENGLSAYRAIFAGLEEHAPGAVLICEHGFQQQQELIELAAAYELEPLSLLKDYRHVQRGVVLARCGKSE